MAELTRPMKGPLFSKRFITDYLRDELPSRCIVYRNDFQMDDSDLPTPVKYLNYEPVAVDESPLIYTVCLSTPRIRKEDTDYHFNPVYRVVYNIRTYVWVVNEFPDGVTDTRDALTVVVRSALLDHPCLRLADTEGILDIGIDEETMTEEYSDITPVKGDRYLAAAYIAYQISMNEVVDRVALGEMTDGEVVIEVID